MKKPCDCGCGESLSWKNRRIAKQASMMQERVDFIADQIVPIYDDAETLPEKSKKDLRDFVQVGRDLQHQVYVEAHGMQSSRDIHLDAPRIRDINGWLKAANHLILDFERKFEEASIQAAQES